MGTLRRWQVWKGEAWTDTVLCRKPVIGKHAAARRAEVVTRREVAEKRMGCTLIWRLRAVKARTADALVSIIMSSSKRSSSTRNSASSYWFFRICCAMSKDVVTQNQFAKWTHPVAPVVLQQRLLLPHQLRFSEETDLGSEHPSNCRH